MGQDRAKKGDRGEGFEAADPEEGSLAAGDASPKVRGLDRHGAPGETRESGVYESRRPAPMSAAPDQAPCASFADVHARYRELVWVLLRKDGIPEHDAEDLLNKVFTTMNAHINQHGVPRYPGPLVMKMTRNHVRNYRRTQRRNGRAFDSQPGAAAAANDVALPPSQSDPEQLYARWEQWQIVRRVFAMLPAAAARVLKVCDIEERSDEEAAALLECTEKQVRIHRHRARAALRDLVERFTRRRPGGGK
jgi:RNA polymerase sigma factor (sigma-70 family)